MVFFRGRRRRARRRLRLSAVADSIGARNGDVLEEAFSAGTGLNGPLVLEVITLRTGSAVEVAQALIDAAVVAGYPNPPRPPRTGGCVFRATPDLPMLVIETHDAGTVIPHHGEVPCGRTGVIVSLS
jgi:hypothetical protein